MRPEHWIYTIPLRLRSLFRRRAVEQELDEELRYHIERQTELLIARGMRPDEARTAALRLLGGVERRKEECRETRRTSIIESLARDVRHGVRALRRNAGFTTITVLTLALGLGANTAIFTVVNAVLLRPLPYADPSRLVVVQHARDETVSPANALDWQASTRAFERMGAAEYWTPNLAGREKAEEITALHVSVDILPMLGVRPVLGRAFLPEEGHQGRHRVVVLGYDFWMRRFAGDPKVIDQTLSLDNESYSIVGVMPRGFRFAPFWATESQFWAPLVLDQRRTDRGGASLRLFARLKPEVTIDQARAELAAVAARLERQFPGTNKEVTLVPLHEKVVGNVRETLLVLLAAVGFVLLIACANVAHLQLMRSAAREREFAVRTALGGATSRLVQQSLVESLLLSLSGAVLGLALAWGGVRLVVALAPPAVPRLDTIGMDGSVFLFMLGIALFVGLVSGAAPAIAAARANVHGALKESSRSSADSARRRRIRSALVVSEFAMALVLLASAGLAIRSFAALLAVDPGFEPRNTLSLQISLKGTPQADTSRRRAFFGEMIERVRALPGVEDVSAINHLPLDGDDWHFPFAVEGRTQPSTGDGPRAQFLVVRRGYFRTMGIPVRTGRDFTPQDEASGAHVVIVNEAMARRHWPNESPIGRRITVDDAMKHPDWFTVVGVTKDVRQGSWTSSSDEAMYFPSISGGPYPWNSQPLVSFLNPESMTLVVRANADRSGLIPTVERAIGSMERDAAISHVLTMDEVIAREFTQPRFYLLLLGVFAGVALALSTVGVYGVISYSVARRRQELGVRMALGAKRGEVFRLVVGQGMRLALLGGGIGLVLALVTTRFLRTLLYGVRPTDPATFVLVAAVLALVALVACAVPARRASRVDPAEVLRC